MKKLLKQKSNWVQSSRLVLLCAILLLSFLAAALPQTAVRAEDKAPVEMKDIIILHTNDMHGRVLGDSTPGKDGLPLAKGVVGFARYKTLIETMKALHEDSVLVLDAGDTTHGTNLATLSKGQSVIRLMNEVGFDAMAIGNHEFNYGYNELELLAKEADFPLLAANIVKTADESKPFPERQIFERAGLKIGVFGLSTPESKTKSSPPNTEGLEFRDPAVIAQEQVDLLKAEGCDAIIMLGHLGIDEESEFTSKYVLDKVPGIDLAIDGHSHSTLPEGEVYNETLLVQTGAMAANVGYVVLHFEDGKLSQKTARLIDFVSAQQYAPDEAVAASIAAIEVENERITKEVVGQSKVVLDGEREDVRTHETNLADLVVDAILEVTQADCAISNGGNVRASIPAGPITVGDLLTVLPFANMVTVIEVSGKDIKDALIYGTDAYPGTAGKFPHVAGLSYTLKKGEDGKFSCVDILLKGAEIEDDKLYKLATNDFMAIGGDGYEMFKGKPQLLLEGLLVDVVQDFIAKRCQDGAELEYGTDGRIKIVE